MLCQAELLPVLHLFMDTIRRVHPIYNIKYGAPERSRTPNLLIRSQTLYPIELRAHKNGAEDGIRTRDPHLGKVVFYH